MSPPFSASELEARKLTLGSSEVAAVLGVDPYKSPHNIWLDKMGLATFAGNDATEAGNDFEPIILARYARHHSVTLRPGRTVPGPESFMSATPDAFIEGGGLVEAKLVGDTIYEWGGEEDGAPWRYLVQCQYQLACTGEPFVDIAMQHGTRAPRYIRILPDLELQATIIERCRDWWRAYIPTRDAPPADHTKGASQMLGVLHPRSEERALVASNEAESLAAKLLQVRQAYDDAVTEERRIENRLKEIMRDAALMVGSEWRCTWRTSRDGKRPLKFKHKSERKVAA